MKHESRTLVPRIVAALGSLALALTLSSPVLAGHKGHHGHKHGHKHDHRRHVVELRHVQDGRHPAHVRYVAAPTWIRDYQAAPYRPYFRGHVHYAPHRHAHAVYAFPVWHDRAWVYEPRHYCGGQLFLGNHVAYRGPGVSFHIAF